MRKVANYIIIFAFSLVLLSFDTSSYADDQLCPNVSKERCPYCSTYIACCNAWTKCKNPERVIGIYRNRTRDVGELPMCAAVHRKDSDYQKISIVNDTDQTITVKVNYRLPLLFNQTKRMLRPEVTYHFKYDKHLLMWDKYVQVNGLKKKINNGDVVKLSSFC